MNLSKTAVVLTLFAGTFLFACGGSSSNSSNFSDTSTSQVYADAWDEIQIDANLAKTKITTTGHYETTKNACSRPADGAMDLTEWNTFATNMNKAAKSIHSTDPKICFPIDYRACMDGTVVFVRDDGSKVTLFQPGDPGETCTHLQDRDLAQQLYKSINGLTYAADRAGCTLEYERCTR